jgi:hypothetical protein
MSLSQTLLKNVENIVESFIDKIVEKYSLDKEELVFLWTNGAKTPKSTKPAVDLESVDMDDISLERLHKCNKAELVALCKSRGCKCTGTKEILIDRLLGKEETTKDSKNKAESNTETKSSAKTKKTERATASIDVVKKLTADIPVIPIRRNAYGNLEHPETGLVFDRKTETVIGKQQDDGTIADLTDEDIEACKRFKFKYTTPDNLEKKGGLDNVKIEELGDDSDIEVVEDGDEEEVEIDDDDEEKDEDEIIEEEDE